LNNQKKCEKCVIYNRDLKKLIWEKPLNKGASPSFMVFEPAKTTV